MTRRHILQQAFVFPLALSAEASSAPSALQIISEPNCLSQESAAGFRLLHRPSNVILLCGMSALGKSRALQLREQALRGKWIVFESSPRCTRTQARVLQHVFGIALSEPVVPSPDHLFARYIWPHAALTRSFSAVIPVSCSSTEAIAHYGGVSIAMQRRIGRGGLVFLGSMLGPNLRAEEPEATKLAAAIFSGTTSAGTSTAASTNM
ncbi:MAG TPA: hypothetical protein VHU83_02405 [Bryobacteraceae bacterium]|nr:hypothetical protein [Bryobacteraceae bacterium]